MLPGLRDTQSLKIPGKLRFICGISDIKVFKSETGNAYDGLRSDTARFKAALTLVPPYLWKNTKILSFVFYLIDIYFITPLQQKECNRKRQNCSNSVWAMGRCTYILQWWRFT